ncbi:MAG: DNA helicase, partial [Planctomycetes bacterium]|nr:DNA helicase [Planctomycetota bacterium]
RGQAEGAGLSPLTAAVQAGQVAPAQVRDAFERSYLEGWRNAVVDASPVLREFTRAEHERRVTRFRELDKALIETSAQLVRARLAASVPARAGRFAQASESGILNRQLELQRRHMPIRKLFRQIPNLLPRLKPCLLMSPLSVAQYLDPKTFPPFDLVIFDEASQIPVWDAIGAIARGRHAIVVGDSKQLPPTRFFARGDDGEAADAEDFEELESILDECNAAGLPSLGLTWHYRSQHESLITFSNYHYYDNRLLTFPSAVAEHPQLGVTFRPVPDGVYDRSKSRSNLREAEAIVAHLVAALRASLERPPRERESFGVVTFSSAQQTLIKNLLDAACVEDPELLACFDGTQPEPVFVKNLENVQGDERDVILFSICYAPDAGGHMAMSFGPVNRDGGERRLNVAITRARKRVEVFSTIRADAISLSKTRSVGVAHLKTFLDYAERGPRAIAEATTLDPDADFESPFEREVYRALTRRGHDVALQVGCSGTRIDLAVRDPERPGRFLLGIECDGASYRSSATARDRDRLRQGVLESLGWTLHRIWSSDWWRTPDQELARLEAAIAAAARARPPAAELPHA